MVVLFVMSNVFVEDGCVMVRIMVGLNVVVNFFNMMWNFMVMFMMVGILMVMFKMVGILMVMFKMVGIIVVNIYMVMFFNVRFFMVDHFIHMRVHIKES